MTGNDDSAYYSLQFENISNFSITATTVVVYYDFLLTFSDEVRYIWTRKFTLPTLLFIINRYTTLLSCITLMLQILPYQLSMTQPLGNMICGITLRAYEAVSLVFLLNAAVFMALRMYAIWTHDLRIFIGVLFLGLSSPALNAYYFTTIVSGVVMYLPSTGCEMFDSLFSSEYVLIYLGSQVSEIIISTLVLLLTLIKTARIIQDLAQFRTQHSLTGMILRDGSIYFVSLCSINVAVLIFPHRGSPASFMLLRNA